MLRRPTENGITQAARRPLKIFASDPLLGRTFGNRARIDIVNEPLQAGPVGSRLEVIDYDGAQDCFYSPVNLDLPAILMQGARSFRIRSTLPSADGLRGGAKNA